MPALEGFNCMEEVDGRRWKCVVDEAMGKGKGAGGGGVCRPIGGLRQGRSAPAAATPHLRVVSILAVKTGKQEIIGRMLIEAHGK